MIFSLYEELKGLPSHWLNDITVYSLNELLQVNHWTVNRIKIT